MKFDDVLREVGDFGTYQRVLFTVLCLPTVIMAMHYMAPVFIMATPDHREVGDFGTYQRVLFTVLCLPTVFMAMHYMAPVFIMATPDHRCAIPGLLNDTYEIQSHEHELVTERYIPKDSSGTWSSCEINVNPFNVSGNVTRAQSCDRWVYSKTPFTDTVVTDLTLVCSRTFYKATAITAPDVGALIGYLTLGPVVDKFGRKRGYLLVLFLTSLATTALVWQPNIYVAIGLRAILGCVSGLVYNTAFVYAVEFIGMSQRTLCGIIMNNFWAAGMLIQTGMAYGLRSWRDLQLAMSIPMFSFVVYWWIIPESLWWLLTHGKSAEVQTLVMRMAKVNKVTLSDHHLDIEEEAEKDEEMSGVFTNLLLTLKDKTIALRSFIVYLDWLVVSLLYYGLSLNVGNLGGDIYVNYAISSAVEVVACTVSVPIIWWMGRKKFYCVCMLIGGVSLLASAAADMYGNDSLHWVMIALAMVGKMVATAAYAVVYLFTAELFPTVIRSVMINLSSFAGSLGNIVAPYIVVLVCIIGDVVPGAFAKELPLLVFGISSIIAGLSSLVLPETGDDNLPDTIVDIRTISKKKAADTS